MSVGSLPLHQLAAARHRKPNVTANRQSSRTASQESVILEHSAVNQKMASVPQLSEAMKQSMSTVDLVNLLPRSSSRNNNRAESTSQLLNTNNWTMNDFIELFDETYKSKIYLSGWVYKKVRLIGCDSC